ncbi:MAG: hypothetical protein ACPGJV_05165 [Bacteriovoracaceae bacterium]
MRQKVLSLIIVVSVTWSLVAMGQDERSLKLLLRKKVDNSQQTILNKTHYRFSTDWYQFDLDGDKRDEYISFEKVDGIDHIVIRNYRKYPIFKKPFLTQAIGGVVHKVRIKNISKDVKLLLIYYFEGVTEYIDFQSTGRLYFVTWEKNDLNTLSISRGPFYWQEYKNYKGNYFKRKYEVLVQDFNGDGLEEVMSKYHHISRVYHYAGRGVWKKLPPE